MEVTHTHALARACPHTHTHTQTSKYIEISTVILRVNNLEPHAVSILTTR